jgi:hypothetical protein
MGLVAIRVRSGCGLVVNQGEVSHWLGVDQGEVRLCLVVNQNVSIYRLCGDQGEVSLWFAGESECGHLLALW